MTSGIACALEGFVLNCGLLLAIGGQASFVLRQGAVGRHVAWVVLICSLCDVVLIGVGTLGTGGHPLGPGQARALALAGAAFMIAYGTRSMLSAWRADAAAPALADAAAERRLAAVVLGTLAVTLLNPHVYLDAFVLLGGAAAGYAPMDRPWFALGAIAASVGWFVLLGRGSTLVAGLFRRRQFRMALDLAVGAIMWRAAAALLVPG